MYLHKIALFMLLLPLAATLSAQQESHPPTPQPSVYLVVFRTPAHVRYSKPEVFHGFATDLKAFLQEKNVPIKVDPERGTIETESPMSVGSMLNIARQVRATSLLFVTVDRPFTKWIKVTLQSYDLDGKLLWTEEASDAGSLTGKGGYKKSLERIEKDLEKRLGGPGLPVANSAGGEPKPAPKDKEVEP